MRERRNWFDTKTVTCFCNEMRYTLWRVYRSSWCLFRFPSWSLLFFYKSRFSELSLEFFHTCSFPYQRRRSRDQISWETGIVLGSGLFFSGLGVPLWFHCLHSHWLRYVAHLLMYFMTVLCKFCFYPLQKVQHQLEGIIKKTWFILKSMNPEENRITKYPPARHQKLQAAEIPDILLKYTEPLTYSRLQIPLT